MTIEKKNTYISGPPTQNLTNLSNNVEWESLGLDRSNISVNFGVSPAQVTVKQGSWIEVNGNRYLITADETFAMASAAHNYITFTDNPSPAFGSAAVKGAYNDSKIGVYQADNITRTLRWYIDQTEETYNIDDSLLPHNIGNLKTEVNSFAIDGTVNKGVQLYAASGISGDHNSDPFYLYKPSTLVIYTDADTKQFYPSGAGAVLMPRWQLYIELEYNGGWNAFMDLGVSGYNDTVVGNGKRFITNYLANLNPGRYRVTLLENWGTAGPFDLEVYLVGAYGQANLSAGSVYA